MRKQLEPGGLIKTILINKRTCSGLNMFSSSLPSVWFVEVKRSHVISLNRKAEKPEGPQLVVKRNVEKTGLQEGGMLGAPQV